MVVTLITLAIGVGLAALSGYLLQKRQKNLTKADKPTTLASRGSFVQVVLGPRRVGPIFGWAGNRRSAKEKVGGGKGGVFSSPKQTVYYEAGWHKLCVGPAFCLRRIYQHGKVIFEGPITSDTHPSGSTFDLGKEGKFRIFWGERTQPINTFLGSPNNGPPLGISSRWPGLCYIEWNDKRLGAQPTWPLLDYVVEARPTYSESILPSTLAYIPPGKTLAPPARVVTAVQNGVEWNGSNGNVAGAYIIQESLAQLFPAKHDIAVVGVTGIPDGDYDILGAEVFQFQIGVNQFGQPIFENRTRVFPEGGLTGATASGSITPYVNSPDDGINPAHLVAEILFAPAPIGNSLDESEWDFDSLDQLGILAQTEGLACSYVAADGEQVDAAVGAILQDLGCMLPLDPETGLLRFVPVRKPTGTIKEIREDNQDVLPEIEVIHSEPQSDRMVFLFPDRENNYNDMPVQVDEDGNASYGQFHRAKQIQIVSTVNYDTAAKIAERRSQEEIAVYAGIEDVATGRDARSVIPGESLILNDYPDVLLVTSVQPKMLEPDTAIAGMPNHYGVPITQFQPPKGNTGGGLLPASPDLEVGIIEFPEHADPAIGQGIFVARIRAHVQISSADFYFSPDNTSYTFIDDTDLHQAGGDLIDPLPADGPGYLAQGPTFTILGPDINIIDAITPLTDTDWRLGRLICALISSTGVELCFVRTITMVAAGTYRLDDVIRGRYDTEILEHSAGAQVFLFEQSAIELLTDILLQPNSPLYVKVPTESSAGAIPLSASLPVATVLEGKGVRPMRPAEVRVLEPSLQVPIYNTGGNIKVAWMYRSTVTAKTGAGQQPAGTVIAAPSPIEGVFEIELDNGSTTGTIQVGAVTEYEITNAEIVGIFGGQPTTMTIRVRNTEGGLKSLPRGIEVERV